MPKNRKMQNIIGTEHITDTAEAAIAAQAASGNVLDDTSPQLGGNLDVNGNALVSTSNGNIELNPNGSGKVVFKGNATKGAGQFVLNCEQNTHGIIIKGPPHSASASYTLTLPDDDGSANEVLKTDGSGNLSWVAQSSGGGGGLSKAVGVGILSADPFANNSSYQSAYPLWACTTNTNGTGWSGYPGTTEMHMIPFQVPIDGDLAELAFRTSGSAWGPITTYWAIYGVGSDNLPVGAPLFNTSFSISPGNEYEFAVTGVTGKSAGDLLYFAFLGVTDIATITMQIGNMRDGGFGFIFPRRISSSNINHQILRNYTMLKYTGATAGTFPTIGANHAFDNTVSNTFLLNIGARYS